MATSTKVGSFTLNTSTGSQSVTGLGFQPKLVLFWGQELVLNEGSNELRRTFGAAASSSARWATADSMRCSPVNQDQQFRTDRAFFWNDAPNDVEQAGFDFTSMGADGFTISVTTGKAVTVNYFALGGTDVSVKVGSFNSSATNGASQAVTGVGFQPKFLLASRSTPSTSTSISGENHWALGMAVSATTRANTGYYAEGNSPSPVRSFQRTDKFMCMVDNSAFNQTCELSTFDSDGFTLAWGLSGLSVIHGYVALGGTATYNVMSFNANTSTGSQAVTGLGFTPVALMMLSNGVAASSLLQNASFLSVGATDGSNHRSTAHWIGDNSTSSSVPSANSSTTVPFIIKDSASSGNKASASLTSLDSDGFTLNWTAVSGAAVQVLVFAVKAASSTVNVTLSTLFAQGQVGSTTVVGKAGVTLSGLAATKGLGSVTVSTVTRVVVTVTGVAGTLSVGSTTETGTAAVSLEGVSIAGATGTATVPAPITSAVPQAMPDLLLGAIRFVHVELPKFGVLPNFTPDHVNTAADPSQPTRWTNVLPP